MSPEMILQLFSSDLDGTLIGEPASTERFLDFWNSLPRHERPILVYNSGRSIDDMRQLLRSIELPTPNYLIGGVGTQLFDCSADRSVSDLDRQFRHGWDLAKVEDLVASLPGIRAQPADCQHPYKSSWFLEGADAEILHELRAKLTEAGISANVVYSSQRDLDILPSLADKGQSLSWLCRELGIPLHSTVVAGDSANDTAMFLLPEVRGIAVANAHHDLVKHLHHGRHYQARGAIADGCIEGLRHFGLSGGN